MSGMAADVPGTSDNKDRHVFTFPCELFFFGLSKMWENFRRVVSRRPLHRHFAPRISNVRCQWAFGKTATRLLTIMKVVARKQVFYCGKHTTYEGGIARNDLMRLLPGSILAIAGIEIQEKYDSSVWVE